MSIGIVHRHVIYLPTPLRGVNSDLIHSLLAASDFPSAEPYEFSFDLLKVLFTANQYGTGSIPTLSS